MKAVLHKDEGFASLSLSHPISAADTSCACLQFYSSSRIVINRPHSEALTSSSLCRQTTAIVTTAIDTRTSLQVVVLYTRSTCYMMVISTVVLRHDITRKTSSAFCRCTAAVTVLAEPPAHDLRGALVPITNRKRPSSRCHNERCSPVCSLLCIIQSTSSICDAANHLPAVVNKPSKSSRKPIVNHAKNTPNHTHARVVTAVLPRHLHRYYCCCIRSI